MILGGNSMQRLLFGIRERHFGFVSGIRAWLGGELWCGRNGIDIEPTRHPDRLAVLAHHAIGAQGPQEKDTKRGQAHSLGHTRFIEQGKEQSWCPGHDLAAEHVESHHL